MIDLLAASDLSTAAVDQLVAASLALFAECGFDARNAEAMSHLGAMLRSEERRVGKECRL